MTGLGISVIISARNVEETIEKCLISILNQNYPHEKVEIIVIDDGSQDKTAELVGKYPVKLIKNEYARGPGFSRNIGVKNSQKEILAFIDADCIATRSWLENLICHLSDPHVGSVGGPHICPPDAPFLSKAIDFLWQTFFGAATARYPKISNKIQIVDHNPTCNMAIRRKIFDLVGGFDEALWPAEDVQLGYVIRRLGYVNLYVPNAIVWHNRPKTLLAFSKMMFRYGFSRAKLTLKHPRTIKPIFLLPSLFLLLIFLVSALGYFNILYLMAILYTLVAFYTAAKVFVKSRDLRHIFMIPMLGFIEHLFYGMGFLSSLCITPFQILLEKEEYKKT